MGEHIAGPRVTRRTMLKWSGAAGMLAVVGVDGCAPVATPGDGGSDANGLILKAGFTSRIIAQGGQLVPGTGHTFPIFPDGAATFVDAAVAGGWYYTVNHEIPFGAGGVSSIRFAPDGTITDAYPICEYTTLNCAGGRTPWGTWLTGEEFDGGRIWECDPTVPRSAIPRPAMGAFQHEAAAVANDDCVYLTEDKPNGAFYRFTPDTPGDLGSGVLEVATGTTNIGAVVWKQVPDVSAESGPTRNQVPGTLHFDGGEGIDTQNGLVWFTTKGDNRVWQYNTATQEITLRLQAGGSSILSGVDNLLVDRLGADGTLLVAEDGGDMQVVMIRPDNSLEAIVQVVGHAGSEITGPTFSPDGQRLYFSSQRGPVSNGLPVGFMGGVTYEITGPFDTLLGR